MSRRARVFAFAAGTVALVASLPCIEKRLEPAVPPVASAHPPAVRPTPPVHAAPSLLSAPTGQPVAEATMSESPHVVQPVVQRAVEPSRRIAQAVEPLKRSHPTRHPVAHAARADHARASRWSVAQQLEVAPPPVDDAPPQRENAPPSRSAPSAQSPQWAPRMQTRLIGQ